MSINSASLTSSINLNAETPEEFMISVLPWIEANTGLSRNDRPLPSIDVYPFPSLPLADGSNPSGIFQHTSNSIHLAGQNPMEFVEGVLVHELVHYLQAANPDKFDMGYDPVEKVELLSYQTQANFFSEVLNISSRQAGLTKEFVSSVIHSDKFVERN